METHAITINVCLVTECRHDAINMGRGRASSVACIIMKHLHGWESFRIPESHWSSPRRLYRVHKNVTAPSLSQMNPLYTLTSYVFKLNFKTSIILLSMPRSSKWALPFGFFNIFYVFRIDPMHATCPVLLDFITLIMLVKEYKYEDSDYGFSNCGSWPTPVTNNYLKHGCIHARFWQVSKAVSSNTSPLGDYSYGRHCQIKVNALYFSLINSNIPQWP
jgi:hypothetical protein